MLTVFLEVRKLCVWFFRVSRLNKHNPRVVILCNLLYLHIQQTLSLHTRSLTNDRIKTFTFFYQ